MRTTRSTQLGLGLLSILVAGVAGAQEEPAEEEADRRWANTSELALVQTAGNSESFTFSLRDTFIWNWEKASLTSEIFALRAESTNRVLINEDGEIVDTGDSQLTGEQYTLSSKYDREIRKRLGWYTGVFAERNRLTGFDQRLALGTGLSHLFVANEMRRFKGEAGVGYFDEKPIEGAGAADKYFFGRLFGRYERIITETSDFKADLELISNFENSADFLVNFRAAVTARISAKVALKMSYTMAYRGEPIILTVPGDEPDEPDGTFEFDSLDTILSASLVIAF